MRRTCVFPPSQGTRRTAADLPSLSDEEEDIKAPPTRVPVPVIWFDEANRSWRVFTLNFYPEDRSFDIWNPLEGRHFLKRHFSRSVEPKFELGDFGAALRIRVSCRDFFVEAPADEGSANEILGHAARVFVALSFDEGLPEAFAAVRNALAEFRLVYARKSELGAPEIERRFRPLVEAGAAYVPPVDSCRRGQTLALQFYGPVGDPSEILGRLDGVVRAAATEFVGCGQMYSSAVNPLFNLPYLSAAGVRDEWRLSNFKTTDPTQTGYSGQKVGQRRMQETADRLQMEMTSCCVIFPRPGEAAVEGVLRAISAAGLTLVDFRSDRMSESEALTFFRRYSEAFDPKPLVQSLIAGPCVSLAVAHPSGDVAAAVDALRELAGPRDPAVGRTIAPHSLRALFGTSASDPGVWCSDTAAEAEAERRFLFGGEDE